MRTRFCVECKNFEDRKEIDDIVMCARGHRPGVSCLEFQDKFEGLKNTASKTRFCLECKNFEEIDGIVFCARGHRPGVSCLEFQDRVEDSFYSYIYWASTRKNYLLSQTFLTQLYKGLTPAVKEQNSR